MKKLFTYFSIVCICLALSGCASWIVRPQRVVLLPEERIFTVPAGQIIKMTLDKKPMEMTFPDDMKLVSPTVLVRQEQNLNNALLNKIKADNGRKNIITIVVTILGILGSVFGILFAGKIKNLIPKKITTTIGDK